MKRLCYTTKELTKFDDILAESLRTTCRHGLKDGDNRARNRKLDQAQFIDIGSQKLLQFKKGNKVSLVGWLAFVKRWSTEKEPTIPWLGVDEGIFRLREIAV